MAVKEAIQNFIVGQYIVDFCQKLKLEIATSEEQVNAIVDAVIKAANTGKLVTGKSSFLLWIKLCVCAPVSP